MSDHDQLREALMKIGTNGWSREHIMDAVLAVLDQQEWMSPEQAVENDSVAFNSGWQMGFNEDQQQRESFKNAWRQAEAERDAALLLIDSIGRDCAEALGGRPMDSLRRAAVTRTEGQETT